MIVEIEKEYEGEDFSDILSFDYASAAEAVAEAVLRHENCPCPCEVSLTLIDDERMHEINREERGVDRSTDVLSFPLFAYTRPSAFEEALSSRADSFNPDTGKLMLGDILISVPKIKEQALEYGHSAKREFAFLMAHSMLHLLGYDHMTPEEETAMFSRQEEILNALGIRRET